MELRQDQAGRIGRARQALAASHGNDPAELAYRIGVLEWHLAEMLALLDGITGP